MIKRICLNFGHLKQRKNNTQKKLQRCRPPKSSHIQRSILVPLSSDSRVKYFTSMTYFTSNKIRHSAKLGCASRSCLKNRPFGFSTRPKKDESDGKKLDENWLNQKIRNMTSTRDCLPQGRSQKPKF